MLHFIAYHKIAEWGPYDIEGTSFQHFSRHPKRRLEKSLGQTVWVISGERIGSKQKYALCASFTPQTVEDSEGAITVRGEGAGISPPIDITQFAWFPELFAEQNKFSFGLNQTKSNMVIDGLIRLRGLSTRSQVPFSDELDVPITYPEGQLRVRSVSIYERNEAARAACIAHYGTRCFVCGFDFQVQYGDIGIGVIHVHHLNPLSVVGRVQNIDPIKDLRPLCPNCHTAIHLTDPPMTVKQLQQRLEWTFD